MNPDSELVSLIDTALGLPISESTLANLRAYKEQIQSGSIEDDDRKYVVALCKRLLRQEAEFGAQASKEFSKEFKEKVDATNAEFASNLSDESLLTLYESIRQQVSEDLRLGSRYRLLGETAKQQSERLFKEIERRHLHVNPILWK